VSVNNLWSSGSAAGYTPGTVHYLQRSLPLGTRSYPVTPLAGYWIKDFHWVSLWLPATHLRIRLQGPKKCAYVNCNSSTVLLISCHIKNFSTFIFPYNHLQASRSFYVVVQDSSLVTYKGLHRFCDRPLSQMSVICPLFTAQARFQPQGSLWWMSVGRSDTGQFSFSLSQLPFHQYTIYTDYSIIW